MSDTFIRIEGLEELIARVDRIAQMTKVKASIQAAALMLKGQVVITPPESHRPQPITGKNKDDLLKNLRGFFWHLQNGDIEIPYRRGQSPGSMKLAQSWTIKEQDSGFTAIVGTNASYARLVMDDDNQTWYHQGTGWGTIQQVRDVHGPEAIDFVRQALVEEVGA